MADWLAGGERVDVIVEVTRDGLEVIRGAEQGEQLAEQHDAAVVERQSETFRVQAQEFLSRGGQCVRLSGTRDTGPVSTLGNPGRMGQLARTRTGAYYSFRAWRRLLVASDSTHFTDEDMSDRAAAHRECLVKYFG